MIRTALLPGIVVVSAGLAASSAHPPRPSNLVIITLDTTRADRLPAYGFASVRTPAIDRLARTGVVFEDAESVAPLTLTAHTSLFTGLYPPHHGVRDNVDAPLGAAHATLAGILHARGFRTGAFVGSMVLAADRGLARGFDVYDDGGTQGGPGPRRRSATEVVDDAQRWIDGLDGEPFFLWVHLYDVHAPQAPPLEFRRAYGDGYEGAIVYMDSQIARLLETLERKGALATSAIVVAGDHGESLGEHGEREHGIFLYEGALHVPLVIRAPGVAPRHVSGITSLVDVLPTLLNLLGIESSPAIDGRSLVPALRGMPLRDRPIYAESMYATRFGWSPLRMLRDRELKYIDAPRPELYDLDADPSEQCDLSAARPAVLAHMRAELAAIGVTTEAVGAPAAGADRQRTLASLGYVSGRAARRTFDARLDPKDFIDVYNAVRHVGR
jgi:choline-sulfatase